jgi:hypothetical protein
MPLKLSTTIGKIANTLLSKNLEIITEFLDFMIVHLDQVLLRFFYLHYHLLIY